MKIIEGWREKQLHCSNCGGMDGVKYESRMGYPLCAKCMMGYSGECDEQVLSDSIMDMLKTEVKDITTSTYSMGNKRGIHVWDKTNRMFRIEIVEMR